MINLCERLFKKLSRDISLQDSIHLLIVAVIYFTLLILLAMFRNSDSV